MALIPAASARTTAVVPSSETSSDAVASQDSARHADRQPTAIPVERRGGSSNSSSRSRMVAIGSRVASTMSNEKSLVAMLDGAVAFATTLHHNIDLKKIVSAGTDSELLDAIRTGNPEDPESPTLASLSEDMDRLIHEFETPVSGVDIPDVIKDYFLKALKKNKSQIIGMKTNQPLAFRIATYASMNLMSAASAALVVLKSEQKFLGMEAVVMNIRSTIMGARLAALPVGATTGMMWNHFKDRHLLHQAQMLPYMIGLIPGQEKIFTDAGFNIGMGIGVTALAAGTFFNGPIGRTINQFCTPDAKLRNAFFKRPTYDNFRKMYASGLEHPRLKRALDAMPREDRLVVVAMLEKTRDSLVDIYERVSTFKDGYGRGTDPKTNVSQFMGEQIGLFHDPMLDQAKVLVSLVGLPPSRLDVDAMETHPLRMTADQGTGYVQNSGVAAVAVGLGGTVTGLAIPDWIAVVGNAGDLAFIFALHLQKVVQRATTGEMLDLFRQWTSLTTVMVFMLAADKAFEKKNGYSFIREGSVQQLAASYAAAGIASMLIAGPLALILSAVFQSTFKAGSHSLSVARKLMRSTASDALPEDASLSVQQSDTQASPPPVWSLQNDDDITALPAIEGIGQSSFGHATDPTPPGSHPNQVAGR